MKIKIFYPNREDKIEFTRAELEKLVDEAYKEGYADGSAHARAYSPYITWTNGGNGGSSGQPYYTTDKVYCNGADSSSISTTLLASDVN